MTTTAIVGLEVHDAASTGDYDSLEEFVRSGKFDVNVGDVDWGNKTPLHWACQRGFVECVRLLLDNGAKGTARTETGWTPAHFAAETGKLTALRALHNAGVRVDKKDIYGCTPRRIAEIYNFKDCVRFLLQAEQEIEERYEKLGIIDSSDEEGEDDISKTMISSSVLEEKHGKGKDNRK